MQSSAVYSKAKTGRLLRLSGRLGIKQSDDGKMYYFVLSTVYIWTVSASYLVLYWVVLSVNITELELKILIFLEKYN